MDTYKQVTFAANAEQSDLLLAALADKGYDGFEEEEGVLHAFTTSKDFDEVSLKEIADRYKVTYTTAELAGKNWNAVWEAGFEPVIVEDFAAIRASFHAPIDSAKYDIVITPKMSFGTGHHATTYMMIEEMKLIEFTDKTVFDFGTGTGILAILASKLGAKTILATDYDDWSISNSKENLDANKITNVELLQMDGAPDNRHFDIILANINKIVIIENLKKLADSLNPGGIMILSGLLDSDDADIRKLSKTHPVQFVKKNARNKWISLRFSR